MDVILRTVTTRQLLSNGSIRSLPFGPNFSNKNNLFFLKKEEEHKGNEVSEMAFSSKNVRDEN